MATRALVGFISTDAAGNHVLTSTYNHYDGYPENLGKGLDNHYSSPEKAREIANMGYISYLDPASGEIEAKHKEPADQTKLADNFEDAMMEVAQMGDSYGADYIYIYDTYNNMWVDASLGGGTRKAMNELGEGLFDMARDFDEMNSDDMNEDYNTKWNKFLNEESFDQAFDRIDKEEDVYPGKYPVEKIMSQALFRLQDEPKEMLDAYKASLANDIRLNGKEQYEDYSVEDFVEDYENYIADKMDS